MTIGFSGIFEFASACGFLIQKTEENIIIGMFEGLFEIMYVNAFTMYLLSE